MYEGIIFALITALIFGVWTVFHQQASTHINPLFGAIIIATTSLILGLILLLPKIKSTILYTNPKGIVFVVLVGICALAIDVFALKAYSSGLQVSIGGPIIIAGGVAIAAIIGFFLGESITVMKIVGLSFIILGTGILATLSR